LQKSHPPPCVTKSGSTHLPREQIAWGKSRGGGRKESPIQGKFGGYAKDNIRPEKKTQKGFPRGKKETAAKNRTARCWWGSAKVEEKMDAGRADAR